MTSEQDVLEVAVPAITFFLMMVVGMDLKPDNFRKVHSFPRAFVIGTFVQYLLPLCAIVALKLLTPAPAIAGGMILLASSPGGGISNYYTYLARVNVALSVILTAVSCLAASVTMPLLLRVFEFVLSQRADYHVPLKLLFGQLTLFLLIPLLAGYAIRLFRQDFVLRHKKAMGRIGFLALGGLIAFILYATKEMFLANWLEITKSAALFVFLSMVLGYHAGIFFGLNRKDSFTLLIECGVRNVAIATTAAVVILKQTEFATLAAIYVLIQALLILLAIAFFRNRLG